MNQNQDGTRTAARPAGPPEWEYQTRSWSPPPKQPQRTSAWSALISGPGLIEIKPHNAKGRAKGIVQLNRRVKEYPPAGHTHWLVTYRAVDGSGKPVRTGTAPQVQIWAQRFEPPKPPATVGQLTGDLYDLGTVRLNRIIPFPRVDLPGFFGMAVEEPIRNHVTPMLIARGRRPNAASGGASALPDLLWSELASMYRELAAEFQDPFLAELAGELGRLGQAA